MVKNKIFGLLVIGAFLTGCSSEGVVTDDKVVEMIASYFSEHKDELKGEKGEPGADGVDGLNGQDGVDGLNGQDGVDGTNGITTFVVTNASKEWTFLEEPLFTYMHGTESYHNYSPKKSGSITVSTTHKQVAYRWYEDKMQFLIAASVVFNCNTVCHCDPVYLPVYYISTLAPTKDNIPQFPINSRYTAIEYEIFNYEVKCTVENNYSCLWDLSKVFTYQFQISGTKHLLSREENYDWAFYSEKLLPYHPLYGIYQTYSLPHFIVGE